MKEKQYVKRKLEELNLIDDFLFGSVLSYPEIGEEFARTLLETVFARKIGSLKVIPQKIYFGADTDLHGARLDVYIEELEGQENVSAVYDAEPHRINGQKDRESLPRRVRFYHALMDRENLKSGEDYQALKNVVVLMILPDDPFGKDYMVYTIRNHCEQLPNMPYEDGVRTIFLYTKGTKGNASEELRQMLRYFEQSTEENVQNETLQNIHRMVDRVKRDKEVSKSYMIWSERIQRWKEEAREEGREEGRMEGREEGRMEGREEGRMEGREEGRMEGREEERKRTEEERKRAEAALREVVALKEKLRQLEARLN